PLRSNSTGINANAKWNRNGLTVAGGNGSDSGINQLKCSWDLYVDNDQTIYVADAANCRIVEWKCDVTSGQMIAGEYGRVVVDQLGIVYITDRENHRIMRWLKGVTQGTVIAGGNRSREQSNQLNCSTGLSFDGLGNLYVVDFNNNRVQTFNID
ncbi:unnamed protein product, partial [Rotaria sp. Silwood2]